MKALPKNKNGETARVAFSVTDTGLGMDKDTQARMLLPFERGTQSSGSGLGLAICASLVQQVPPCPFPLHQTFLLPVTSYLPSFPRC